MAQEQSPEATHLEGNSESLLICDLASREVYLNKSISPDVAAKFCNILRHLDHQDQCHTCDTCSSPIIVYINSSGGELRSAYAMIDCMRSLKSSVITIVEGEASSAAALIAMAGTPGMRLVTPNSLIMIHQASGGVSGTATEVTDYRQALELEMEMMVSLISQTTGKQKRSVRKDLRGDLYLTAKQALEYGSKGMMDHIHP